LKINVSKTGKDNKKKKSNQQTKEKNPHTRLKHFEDTLKFTLHTSDY